MKKLLILLLLLFTVIIPTKTEAQKICDMTSGAPALSNDYIEVSKNCAGTRKLTLAEVKTFMLNSLLSDIVIDNTSFKVLESTDLQTLFEETDDALLNARATGVRYGGTITGLGTSTATVAAGAGSILDNSDPITPTYTNVLWSSASGIALSSGLNWLYVDDTGTINTTTTEPTHDDYRTQIYLGRVSVTGGVISGISPSLVSLQQTPAQIWDVFKAYGVAKSGQTLQASGSNLKIKISSGEVYSAGINFSVDATNPHEKEFSTFDTGASSVFRMVKQDGVIATDVTDLPVANYDLGGTITAIPGASTRAQIFTVYRFPSGNVRILYGQSYYNSVTEAYTNLGTYTYTAPNGFDEAIILGYIIVSKSATNLSDPSQARFITSNRFGGVGGAVSTETTIVGPASSTDNTLARFDGTTGKALQGSAIVVGDGGNTAITANDSAALVVGQNGATNPAFAVDTSSASSATGIAIKSFGAGGSVTITATSSGSNENLTISPKGGSGKVRLDGAYAVLGTFGTDRLVVDGYNSVVYSTYKYTNDKTVTTSGTTGNTTINKPAGCVNFAASASTLTVTNSVVGSNSVVVATVNSSDATMKSVYAVVSSGSFILTANAAATAETKVCFTVFN